MEATPGTRPSDATEPIVERLVVVSHKACWRSPDGPSGWATNGGFPLQMDALSALAAETRLCVPVVERTERRRDGEVPFRSGVQIVPLPEQHGAGLGKKVRFPYWLLRAWRTTVGEIRAADAVHCPVPGDVGTAGIALASVLRRPLFVRYCGNWMAPSTRSERLLRRFLERRAGGTTVVLATGGSDQPPSDANPAVSWVFSTTLSDADMAELPVRTAAPSGSLAPRLVTVGRQEPYKGTGSIIDALPDLAERHPHVHLDVVGDGTGLDGFRRQAAATGVADRVTFHGQVGREAVLDILAASDVFVFPTRGEGFPKAVGEALAVGLPVVTSPVSVLPHLVGEHCGTMLADTTATEVAAAVERLVADEARFAERTAAALETGRALTLERWVAQIRGELVDAWGLTAT